MRCFAALDLSAGVRRHLVDATADLRRTTRDVKWVPVDQLHLTLVFAGDLPPEDADGWLAELRAIALPALRLTLRGCGAFPPRGVPRVLWAGLAGDVDALAKLQAAIADAGARHGVPREKRPFTAHVTLGRVQSPFGALALLDRLREAGDSLSARPFTPPALVLYRSDLGPGGAVHTPLLERPMPAPAD